MAATTHVIKPTGKATTKTAASLIQGKVCAPFAPSQTNAPTRYCSQAQATPKAKAHVQIGRARRSRQRLTCAPKSNPPAKMMTKISFSHIIASSIARLARRARLDNRETAG